MTINETELGLVKFEADVDCTFVAHVADAVFYVVEVQMGRRVRHTVFMED